MQASAVRLSTTTSIAHMSLQAVQVQACFHRTAGACTVCSRQHLRGAGRTQRAGLRMLHDRDGLISLQLIAWPHCV